ncbi:MAG TPA: DUF6132 family protein [Saprospiraceae bacterium]|nr:DUF6132 family protein [Saprospiraceae bacterium]
MTYIIKHKLTIIGLTIGAISGYFYYHFVGCVQGTCSITSDPTNSTLYGGMMGALLLNMFEKKDNSKTNNSNK